jgi:LPXTG-site transpeptidase (sortase) family protein
LVRKSTVLTLAGFIILLAAAAYFWQYYRLHAPSPFDIADPQTEPSHFIPIIVPVVEGGESAPTMEGTAQATQEAERPTGLVPDRIQIPVIYLDAPVLPVHYKDIETGGEVYHQWRVPAEFAAGWQDESALLGEVGNTVLNGHHNAYGMVFANLVKLSIGDEIIVSSGDVEYRYLVAAKMLLPERGESLEKRMENARWLATSQDERLTLVTCWPADSNTHRVIVVAYPEGYTPPTGGQ